MPTTLCLVFSLVLAFPAFADPISAALTARLASSERPETDRARDAGRRPAEVVSFLGVKPGMTVIDLVAAGGYYTEVMSLAVGPEGKVYAQNSAFVLKLRDGANEKAISARLAGGRLANVERLDRSLADTGLEPGSVDAAITALNFHDIFNGSGRDASISFLKATYALLEPGGVLGLIDHHGVAGNDNAKLHRIQRELVVDAIRESGFVIEAEGEMLRNPADDHTRGVFDPEIRGKTDRFVLRLRKPQG